MRKSVIVMHSKRYFWLILIINIIQVMFILKYMYFPKKLYWTYSRGIFVHEDQYHSSNIDCKIYVLSKKQNIVFFRPLPIKLLMLS